MASVLCRSVSGIVRRTALVASSRAMSDVPHIDPHKGKVATLPEKGKNMPDNLGHSVGAERFELLAQLAGNEDPFEMNVRPRTKGTLDDPTLIPSMYGKRLVGCICEADSITINWMQLHKGESKRCGCGYFFKLVEVQHQDYGQ